jgi:hypothetical protein
LADLHLYNMWLPNDMLKMFKPLICQFEEKKRLNFNKLTIEVILVDDPLLIDGSLLYQWQ